MSHAARRLDRDPDPSIDRIERVLRAAARVAGVISSDTPSCANARRFSGNDTAQLIQFCQMCAACQLMENPNPISKSPAGGIESGLQTIHCLPTGGISGRQPRNEPVLKNCTPEHAYQSGRWHINDVLKSGANTEEIMELGEHLLGRAQSDHRSFAPGN